MRAQPIRNDEGRTIGAQWKCFCGCRIEAFGCDVDCEKCGQLFNAFGQALKPQSQWGEGHDY